MPEPIAKAFNSSRAKDVTVINELVTAYKKNPEAVRVWLEDDSQELTRGSVKLLREFLEEKSRNGGAEIDRDSEDAQSPLVGAGERASSIRSLGNLPRKPNRIGSRSRSSKLNTTIDRPASSSTVVHRLMAGPG